MTSQSCESFFRLLRAASPTSSTQRNFSTKSFAANRAKNVDISIKIRGQNEKDGLVYPQSRKLVRNNPARVKEFELLSEEDIENRILKAQSDAETELASLGDKMVKKI